MLNPAMSWLVLFELENLIFFGFGIMFGGLFILGLRPKCNS